MHLIGKSLQGRVLKAMVVLTIVLTIGMSDNSRIWAEDAWKDPNSVLNENAASAETKYDIGKEKKGAGRNPKLPGCKEFFNDYEKKKLFKSVDRLNGKEIRELSRWSYVSLSDVLSNPSGTITVNGKSVQWHVKEVHAMSAPINIGAMSGGDKWPSKGWVDALKNVHGFAKVGKWNNSKKRIDWDKKGLESVSNVHESKYWNQAKSEQTIFCFCIYEMEIGGKKAEVHSPQECLAFLAKECGGGYGGTDGYDALMRGLTKDKNWGGGEGNTPAIKDVHCDLFLPLLPKNQQGDILQFALQFYNLEYYVGVNVEVHYSYDFFSGEQINHKSLVNLNPNTASTRNGIEAVFPGQMYQITSKPVTDHLNRDVGGNTENWTTKLTDYKTLMLTNATHKEAKVGGNRFGVQHGDGLLRGSGYNNCFYNVAGVPNESNPNTGDNTSGSNYVKTEIKDGKTTYRLTGVMVTYESGDFLGYNNKAAMNLYNSNDFKNGKKTMYDVEQAASQGGNIEILALAQNSGTGLLDTVDPTATYKIVANNVPEYYLSPFFRVDGKTNGKLKTSMTQEEFATILKNQCRVYLRGRVANCVHFLYAKERPGTDITIKAKYVTSVNGTDKVLDIDNKVLAKALGADVTDCSSSDVKNMLTFSAGKENSFQLFGSDANDSIYNATHVDTDGSSLSGAKKQIDWTKNLTDKLQKLTINNTTYYLGGAEAKYQKSGKWNDKKVDGFSSTASDKARAKLTKGKKSFSAESKLASALGKNDKSTKMYVVDPKNRHTYAVKAKKEQSGKLKDDTTAGYYPVNDVLYGKGNNTFAGQLVKSQLKIKKVGENKIEITLYYYNLTPVLYTDIVMTNKGGVDSNGSNDKTADFTPVLWQRTSANGEEGHLAASNLDLSQKMGNKNYWMTKVRNEFPGYQFTQQNALGREGQKIPELKSFRKIKTTYRDAAGNPIGEPTYEAEKKSFKYQRYGSFTFDLDASPYSNSGGLVQNGTVAAFYNELAKNCVQLKDNGGSDNRQTKKLPFFKVKTKLSGGTDATPKTVGDGTIAGNNDGYKKIGELFGLGYLSTDRDTPEENRFNIPDTSWKIGASSVPLQGLKAQNVLPRGKGSDVGKFSAGSKSSKVKAVVSIYYPEVMNKNIKIVRIPERSAQCYFYYTGEKVADFVNDNNAYLGTCDKVSEFHQAYVPATTTTAAIPESYNYTFGDNPTAVYPVSGFSLPEGYQVTVTLKSTGQTPNVADYADKYEMSGGLFQPECGISWNAGNPVKLYPVTGQKAMAWALYEVNVTKKPEIPIPITVAEEIEEVPFCSSELDPSSDADVRNGGNVQAVIENGSMSSDVFSPGSAIPSSEYLTVSGQAPKYLVRGQWKKHTVTATVPVTYVLQDTKTTYSDGHYFTKTENVAEMTVNVARTTVYYTLDNAAVYTPDTITVTNELLPGKTSVMKANGLPNWSDANQTLGFSVQATGECAAPAVVQTVALDKNSFGDLVGSSFSSIEEAKGQFNEGVLKGDAESRVGAFISRNDSVSFNNGEGYEVTLLADNGYQPVNAEEPDAVPEAGITESGVFEDANKQIPAEQPNDLYKSTGSADFTCKKAYVDARYGKPADTGVVRFHPNVNRVVVYTPAAVNTSFGTFGINNNQSAVETSENTVSLDQEFSVNVSLVGNAGKAYEVPGGSEVYQGYGIKSYARYTKAVQLKFPFPVIPVTETTGTGDGQSYDYYPAGEWITIDAPKAGKYLNWEEKDFKFYVPSWAMEGLTDPGNGKLEARALALNYKEGLPGEPLVNDSVEDPNSFKAEEYADATDDQARPKVVRTHYAATDEEPLGLVGRLYNFSLVDYADYPKWKTYFRDSKDLLTGNAYYSGLSNENGDERGITDKYTVPLINGSHPTLSGTGVSTPGYVSRFKLDSVGHFGGDNDYVRVKPTFYWVSKSNTYNKETLHSMPVEVDVYYNETINDREQKFVKVGGALDKSNKHYLSLAGSKFLTDGISGYGVSQKALKETAEHFGLSATEFSNKETAVWTSSNVMVNKYMRTLLGTSRKVQLSNGNVLDYEVLSRDVVSRGIVDKGTVLASIQDWYFTYYLPSTLYVAAKADGNPEVMKDPSKITWMDGGYLIVNFEISAIHDGKTELLYDASDIVHEYKRQLGDGVQEDYYVNGLNMWQREGYQTSKISADRYKTEFNFNYGDAIVYDLGDGPGNNGGEPEDPDDPDDGGWKWPWEKLKPYDPPHSKGAADDYHSGGTH